MAYLENNNKKKRGQPRVCGPMHGVDLGQMTFQDPPCPHVDPGELGHGTGPLVQVSVLHLIPALLNTEKKEKLAKLKKI